MAVVKWDRKIAKFSGYYGIIMVMLKHGLMCVSRTLIKAWVKPMQESHTLAYLKYVTITTFDPHQL